jgi:hypothetical protein
VGLQLQCWQVLAWSRSSEYPQLKVRVTQHHLDYQGSVSASCTVSQRAWNSHRSSTALDSMSALWLAWYVECKDTVKAAVLCKRNGGKPVILILAARHDHAPQQPCAMHPCWACAVPCTPKANIVMAGIFQQSLWLPHSPTTTLTC